MFCPNASTPPVYAVPAVLQKLPPPVIVAVVLAKTEIAGFPPDWPFNIACIFSINTPVIGVAPPPIVIA